LYSSSNIIWVITSRRMIRVGHVAHTGERRGAQSSGGELEGKRQLGRPKHGWEDDIKTVL
jgi:hypothetical protein